MVASNQVKVRFENVGRGKMTWDETFTADEDGTIDSLQLIRAIRRKGALASKGVDVSTDQKFTSGHIHAGMHAVGTWRIVPESERPTGAERLQHWLNAIRSAKNRNEAAGTYAEAIRFYTIDDKEEWTAINSAIKERWSMSALLYIKKEAWKAIEAVDKYIDEGNYSKGTPQ
jgi:hypothetical protein